MKDKDIWPNWLTRPRTKTTAVTLGLIAIIVLLVMMFRRGTGLRVDGVERVALASPTTVTVTTAAEPTEEPRITPVPLLATASAPASPSPETSLRIVRTTAATVTLGVTTPTDPVAVDFPTATDGWLLAGDCDRNGVCTIYRTTDSGATWHSQFQTHFALHTFSFLTAQDGWLPGEDCTESGAQRSCTGILMTTTDGGKTWTTTRTGDALLSDVQFVSPDLGWAVASGCPLGHQPCASDLRESTDGGATWRTAPLGGFWVSAVHFVDAQRGWIAGCADPGDANWRQGCAHPEMRATTDGGKSWQTQLHLPATVDSFGASLAFVDAHTGWLLTSTSDGCTMGGCWGPLYHTTDGGKTWATLQSEYHWQVTGVANDAPPGFPGAPTFASPMAGWLPILAGAGPGVGGIARTTDGGKTWVRTGALEHWTIEDVSAISARSVWVVGSLADFNFLLHSDDEGQTWTQVLPRLSPAQAADFLDPSHGWGIGTISDPGAVLATTDAGKSWRKLAEIAYQQFRALSFADGQHGWLVGQDSQPPWAIFTLYATADGGRTWHSIAHTSEPVAALRFFSSRNGIMLTSHGDNLAGLRLTTLATSDGGVTWTPIGQDSLGGGRIGVRAADFASLTDGWVVTTDRSGHLHLSATTDGGKSWETIGVIDGGTLPSHVSLQVVADKVGWIGFGHTLLTTEDGGQTWIKVSLPPSLVIASLDVADARVGWLLTTDGRLFQTNDGGTTWMPSGVTSPDVPTAKRGVATGTVTPPSSPPPSTPLPESCGTWSAPNGQAGSMITARYGEIRNCLVIEDQVVITTLGSRQSGKSGVIAIYQCRADDVACHDGRTPHPATGWQFYVPPHVGGVTVLGHPSPGVLLVDNAGDQMCFDLKIHTYDYCPATRLPFN